MEKIQISVGAYAIYKNPIHDIDNNRYAFLMNKDEIEHGLFILNGPCTLDSIKKYAVTKGPYAEFWKNIPSEFFEELHQNTSAQTYSKVKEMPDSSNGTIIKLTPISDLVLKEMYSK